MIEAVAGTPAETLAGTIASVGVERDTDPHAVAAKRCYAEEGAIEIDEQTVLSQGEGGHYVLAWVWVSDEEAYIDPDAAFKLAQEALDAGDAGLAILSLRQARPTGLSMAQLKAVQKAIDELECGSVEAAGTYLMLAECK